MLEAGKFSRCWCPGLTSLIVSNKPPTYPQFGFDWQVVKNIRFRYFPGKLNSGILDSVRTFSNGIQQDASRVYLTRYIAA
ncbi:MAG: hypothetical protein JSU61_08455, partial [Fidelibacterota bacterium]